MKITPDYNGRNDLYDKDTVRYYESLDNDGYFYEMYVMVDGVKSKIVLLLPELAWIFGIGPQSIRTWFPKGYSAKLLGWSGIT